MKTSDFDGKVVLERLKERAQAIPRTSNPTDEELLRAVDAMTDTQIQVVIFASVEMAMIGMMVAKANEMAENDVLRATPQAGGKQIVH